MESSLFVRASCVATLQSYTGHPLKKGEITQGLVADSLPPCHFPASSAPSWPLPSKATRTCPLRPQSRACPAPPPVAELLRLRGAGRSPSPPPLR